MFVFNGRLWLGCVWVMPAELDDVGFVAGDFVEGDERRGSGIVFERGDVCPEGALFIGRDTESDLDVAAGGLVLESGRPGELVGFGAVVDDAPGECVHVSSGECIARDAEEFGEGSIDEEDALLTIEEDDALGEGVESESDVLGGRLGGVDSSEDASDVEFIDDKAGEG